MYRFCLKVIPPPVWRVGRRFMAGLIPNPQLIVQVYPARLVEPGSPREIYSCNS